MKKFIAACSALAAVFTFSGCSVFDDFRAKVSRTESSFYSVARGGRVDLSTPNGAIRVGRSNGNEVLVERITTCRAATFEEAADGVAQVVPEILTGMDFSRSRSPTLDHPAGS
jgi:hypothetical protein